jgi:hypothetical protein
MKLPRTLLFTLSAALMLTLAACETDRRDTATTTDPALTETDPMATDPMVAEPMGAEATVEGTTQALEGGVGNMSPSAAVSNVDGWIARLEMQDFAQRDQIVGGLRDLRAALQETPINGNRVGQIMGQLGDWTSQAGTDANDNRVQRLGQLLTNSGQRLQRGEVTGPAATGTGTPGTGAATAPGATGTGATGTAPAPATAGERG